MSHHNKSSKRKVALKLGFRSGLEKDVSDKLTRNNVEFKFEPDEAVLDWSTKSRKRSLKCYECGCRSIIEEHRYTPDFVLEEGIVLLESKGRFMSADRVKMAAINSQNEDKLVIMLFAKPRTKLSKKSKSTYATWCDKNNIKWLDFGDHRWVEQMKEMIVEFKNDR